MGVASKFFKFKLLKKGYDYFKKHQAKKKKQGSTTRARSKHA